MAEIELPRAISGSPGRPGRSALPDAGDVPQVQPQGDPGVRAPAGAFGSGDGLVAASRGIADAAERLGRAALRMQFREEAVERVRDLGAYNEVVHNEFRRLETEDDLSRTETIQAFGKFLAEKRDEILKSHRGSEESKLRLSERLEAIRLDLGDRAAVASVKAQREMVTASLGREVGSLAAKAYESPGSLNELYLSLDGTLADMAPALPEGQERELRDTYRRQIAKSAVTALIDRGEFSSARKMMDESPEMAQILGADEGRRLRSRITVAEAELNRAAQAGQRKLNELRVILGREPTPEERARAAGVAGPESGRQTLSQKIVDVESVLGRPLTQDETEKLAGLSEGGFGASLTGRALEIMTDDAPSFAAGLLTEAQERRFLSAVTQYSQPTTFQNPDTGLLETRRPELPIFVRTALEQRGISVDQLGQQPRTPGAEPSPTPGPQGARPEPSKTVWGLAGLISGPIPAIGETLGRTPIIGDLMPATEMTQARNFVPQLQRELVRVLQNNPRYAEGERQAIEQEINISPQIFDNPTAFRNRLIAIDDALEVREKQAFETARSKNVGREERVHAMNVLNALVQFRQNLGVPPRVKTPEEVKKMVEKGELKSGDQFIDPQGNVRQVP